MGTRKRAGRAGSAPPHIEPGGAQDEHDGHRNRRGGGHVVLRITKKKPRARQCQKIQRAVHQHPELGIEQQPKHPSRNVPSENQSLRQGAVRRLRVEHAVHPVKREEPQTAADRDWHEHRRDMPYSRPQTKDLICRKQREKDHKFGVKPGQQRQQQPVARSASGRGWWIPQAEYPTRNDERSRTLRVNQPGMRDKWHREGDDGPRRPGGSWPGDTFGKTQHHDRRHCGKQCDEDDGA